MESNYTIIIQKDGQKSKLFHYLSTENVKTSILILHGMAEYKKRYLPFAQFLNKHGIDVYLYDHRGHGTDVPFHELGYIASSKGYQNLVDDALEVVHYIKAHKRSDSFFLMGHSMGSLIARNVIQQYDGMDGVILCGTTHPSKLKILPGIFLAFLIKSIYGSKHPSRLMNKMMFGGKAYSKLIKRTSFDWLSRNHSSVGAYIHDPYCGYLCTISFYGDLLKLVFNATNRSLIKRTRRNLPILIISGDHDPVGSYGKEINSLRTTYQNLGFQKIKIKLYPDCRHELLQEQNSAEVMSDILNWITT